MHHTYPSCAIGLQSLDTGNYGHWLKVMCRSFTEPLSLWAPGFQVASLLIDSVANFDYRPSNYDSHGNRSKRPAAVNQRYGLLMVVPPAQLQKRHYR